MTCSIDGCTSASSSRSLCALHYGRAYRRGELAGAPYLPKYRNWTVSEVLEKCLKVGDCFVWQGTPSSSYPELRHNGTITKVHRFVYQQHTGESADGSQIHHTCANSRCVNPAHLQRASQADNVLEMLARKDYEARIAALEAKVIELEARLTLNGEVILR